MREKQVLKLQAHKHRRIEAHQKSSDLIQNNGSATLTTNRTFSRLNNLRFTISMGILELSHRNRWGRMMFQRIVGEMLMEKMEWKLGWRSCPKHHRCNEEGHSWHRPYLYHWVSIDRVQKLLHPFLEYQRRIGRRRAMSRI